MGGDKAIRHDALSPPPLENVQTNTSSPGPEIYVKFEENDTDNPLNWSRAYKWSLVGLVALLLAMVQLGTIIAAPVSPQILHYFHCDNQLYRTLIVSIWEIGEVFGPLIFGPLSEIYGQRFISNISNGLFVVFFVGLSLSTSISMLIAFRFLAGAAVSAPYLGPGIVSDLFVKEERGLAISLMLTAAVIGPVIGPIVGSYLGQSAGWRWAFWLPTIINGFLSLVFLIVYRETYRITILRRKAARLRKANPHLAPKDIQYQYQSEEDDLKKILTGMVRPLRLLVTSPVLVLATLYLSLMNGYIYLIMTVLAPIIQEEYHFSEGASGLALLGLCVGLLTGSLFCSTMLDFYVKKVKRLKKGTIEPELRLPPVVAAGLLMPIAPIIASGIIAFAYLATSVSLSSYVLDAFGVHGVSAMSAMLFPRNGSAAFLPLAAPPLFARLGYGWGGSVLGFIALAFVPVPLLWLRLGKRLREIGSHRVVE